MATYPVEALEGILPSGQLNLTGNLILSKSNIEILDLICEGEIEGLKTGIWSFSGNLGEVGYRTGIFYPYSGASGITFNSGVKYLPAIYWNEIPVVDSQNKYNYQRVNVSTTNGYPNGELLNQSSPELTISRTIGERLFGTTIDSNGSPLDINQDFTKYYSIYNKDCKGCLVNVKVGQLSEQVIQGDNQGDIIITAVNYKIYYQPIYSNISSSSDTYILGKAEQIQGKVNYGYIRSSRIDFYTQLDSQISTNINFLGWKIKIVRTTPDSVTSFVRNQTYIDSLTEIYGNTYSYPNSAIVRSKFEAEFFNQVPARAYDALLLKIQVPSNYNPITKSYIEGPGTAYPNGWDGTFASGKVWSDNPAWCFYDLLISNRYGLGKYISQPYIDKWTLYDIGKYCDTLVSDGLGGLEPAFTCNLILNSRDDAYKVVNDMASIFRGMTYYGPGGSIYVAQDAPKTPIVDFNNTNIEDGNFTYETSSKRVRHTVAIVRYNDKNSFYKPALEYVEDQNGIRRYGIREIDMTAFGCTSRGQAIRLGKWALLSENLETETVSFTAGMEAIYLKPGDVFRVADSHRKNQRLAGRTYKIENYSNSGVITLDDKIILNTGTLYNLSLLTPGYYYDQSQINNLSGIDTSGIRRNLIQTKSFTGIYGTGLFNNKTQIILNNYFDTGNYNVTGNLLWTIELTSGNATLSDNMTYINSTTDYYRAVTISEKDDLKYDVVGLQYSPDKYKQIESGLSFDRPTTSYLVIPQPPDSLSLTVNAPSQNTKIIYYSFVVNNFSGVTNYRVFTKNNDFIDNNVPDPQYLIADLPIGVTQGKYIPQTVGNYYFRVYTYNNHAGLYSSTPAKANQQVLGINSIRDVVVSSLNYDTITDPSDVSPQSTTRTTGNYDSNSPTFRWQAGINNSSFIQSDLKYRVSLRAPSSNNIPSTTIYYQNTGYVPPSTSNLVFQYGIDINIANGAQRNYDIVVEAIDAIGNTSAGNYVSSPVVDNNWSNFPNGYDIFGATNQLLTGFNLPTGSWALQPPWEKYKSTITYAGVGHINIDSSTPLPTQAIGAMIFFSNTNFSGLQVITGKKVGVNQYVTNNGKKLYQKKAYGFFNTLNNYRIDFDTTELKSQVGTASPGAVGPLPNPTAPNTVYLGVALYDQFDKYFIDNNIWDNPGSGLSGCYNTAAIQSISKSSISTLGITNTASGEISILTRSDPDHLNIYDHIGYYDVMEQSMTDNFTIISTRPRVDAS